MNTEEIAKRLVELCREAKWETAQKELYATDAVSIEPEATPAFEKETRGLPAIMEKGRKFSAMVETMHSLKVSEPIVAGGETAYDIPWVVLIDGGTASAAEIVAGAIRDYDRGTLVGEPTFGKGLVQRVHDFEDGSSARISFARWLTPDQSPIPDEGLAPDIVVARSPDPEVDLQFARTPFMVAFQAGWFQFNLCAVHIYYGAASGAKTISGAAGGSGSS